MTANKHITILEIWLKTLIDLGTEAAIFKQLDLLRANMNWSHMTPSTVVIRRTLLMQTVEDRNTTKTCRCHNVLDVLNCVPLSKICQSSCHLSFIFEFKRNLSTTTGNR